MPGALRCPCPSVLERQPDLVSATGLPLAESLRLSRREPDAKAGPLVVAPHEVARTREGRWIGQARALETERDLHPVLGQAGRDGERGYAALGEQVGELAERLFRGDLGLRLQRPGPRNPPEPLADRRQAVAVELHCDRGVARDQ